MKTIGKILVSLMLCCPTYIVAAESADNSVVNELDEGAESANVGEEKLVMAIKTNLLYDALLTPNIELEIPVRSRFSVNSELGRGWWLRENTRCWELLYGGVEGRFWFGDRSKRDQLTGWFGGVFANAGICDFQFEDASGVQSDFYIAVGISAGYSLKLSDRWMMEFSVGGGYLENEYQKYWVENNETLIEDGQTMRRQSIMPLKAKVSIGWLLFNNRK